MLASVGAIKSATTAGTGCGSCVPLLGELLTREMKRAGKKVSNHLCEHFPHSRQELFHLIRLHGLQSFDALVARHGRGTGCEICKPAVASILASTWNEHVLDERHLGLQDTNDRFLANIQRDGSYSVIPRVPGGEITPDQLIALGRTAQKFGLYSKITGAQRVDLFGARLEQLPAIWRDLIASAPPDALWLEVVREALARVEGTTAPGPTEKQLSDSNELSPEQRAAMVQGMVSNLAERLKADGSDVDGWLRLLRSYMVLGEPEKARAAVVDARRALAGDPTNLRRLDDLVKGLGLEG